MNISSFGVGFRFLPPDEEIIGFFLLNKMKGYHDLTRHIREVDLLKQEPPDLAALSIVQSRYPEWFFFYKLNKSSNGRTERLTKAGYWKSTGQDRKISYGGKVIGTKKTLTFYEGRTRCGVKTDWVMHEYRATADFIPLNTESTYVVGCLRKNVAENTENSISYDGQPSTHFAASSSQNNAVAVSSMEMAPQLRSDFEIALQTQMEEHDILDSDPYNDQNRMEEEEIFLEGHRPYNDWVDDEQSELLFQFDNTIEEEKDFMTSNFPHEDERSYIEVEYPLCPDYRASGYAADSSGTDPESANAWCDQLFLPSRPGKAQVFNLQRMENSVHHEEIVDSISRHHVLPYKINCLESVRKENSVNSRTSNTQTQIRSRTRKSVVQGRPTRVLQMKLSENAVSRDKTRESGASSPVVELVQNKKSIVRYNKSPKMGPDRNMKSDSNSRSSRSTGSSRKNSFKFLEMSQLSDKPNPPLVYVGNVLLGLILIIVVVWEVMFLH